MTNHNFKDAVPGDPTRIEGFFSNDNLTFCSIASLNGFTIRKVLSHPTRYGQKLFLFDDRPELRQLWIDYLNQKLSVEPKTLAIEVSRIKNLPTEADRSSSPSNLPSQYWTPRQKEEYEEFLKRQGGGER